MIYDRMNPTLPVLLERLRHYSTITYGKEAYPLSVAEAKLLVSLLAPKGLNDAAIF